MNQAGCVTQVLNGAAIIHRLQFSHQTIGAQVIAVVKPMHPHKNNRGSLGIGKNRIRPTLIAKKGLIAGLPNAVTFPNSVGNGDVLHLIKDEKIRLVLERQGHRLRQGDRLRRERKSQRLIQTAHKKEQVQDHQANCQN